jgi:poly(hydroxyalkanoate) granule-associated protein
MNGTNGARVWTDVGKAGDEVLSAGRNLWLAGLGALAEMRDGGREAFDRLVERGRPVAGRQEDTVRSLGEKTGKVAREVGKLAQETVEYEARAALKRLGVMTREDVARFSRQLDVLERRIDELAARRKRASEKVEPKGRAAAPVAPAAKAGPPKPAQAAKAKAAVTAVKGPKPKARKATTPRTPAVTGARKRRSPA